jgi:hypothetical protein
MLQKNVEPKSIRKDTLGLPMTIDGMSPEWFLSNNRKDYDAQKLSKVEIPHFQRITNMTVE